MTKNEEHQDQIQKQTKAAIRKPTRLIWYASLVLLVTAVGLGIVLNHFGHTLNHIDRTATSTDVVVRKVTGPQAQQQNAQAQAKVIESLVSQVNCQDQRNLQKLIDNLVAAGMRQLESVNSVIEPKCKLP